MENPDRIETVRRGLSKSRILDHLQCPKRLWLRTFRPELAEVSESAQAGFSLGHEVGRIARQLVPEGILIGHESDLGAALHQTQDVLARHPGTPLFEAAFAHDDVVVRADLLLPASSGWRLAEVKSSTSVKDHYLADCAVQAWAIAAAGQPIERVELAHIDNTFVYAGGGDYHGLFRHEDLTDTVRPLIERVPEWVERCRRTLAGDEPRIAIGDHCHNPHPCPFFEHCRGPQPEFPVTTLHRGGKVARQLLAEGYADLREVPPGRLANPLHERQRRVAVSGTGELDPEAARILAAHPYPRYYVDFEAANLAIPYWPDTRPYQQVLFQWSCHVELADGTLMHEEFLGLPPELPARPFAEQLIGALHRHGPGPVFVYNQSFEASRLRELATMHPDLRPTLLDIVGRLVDLLPLTRAHYDHPALHGSWSLKSVLPTIAPDLDYTRLDHVQHGAAAVEAYAEILRPDTSTQRRDELVQGLRDYCALDTLALVRLVRFLERRSD